MVQRPIERRRPYEALTPLHQGSLDGLCGLYASINAIQLALYPERMLTKRQRQHLFEHGIRKLSHRRQLLQTICFGNDNGRLGTLLADVLAEAADLTGIPLASVPLVDDHPRDIRVAIARIKDSLRDNEPVILSLEGRHEHWTVAVAFTPTRLILFDSAGMSWLRWSSLTLSERSARPHLLSAHGVILISRLHPRRLTSLSKFISVEEVVQEVERDEPSGQRSWQF